MPGRLLLIVCVMTLAAGAGRAADAPTLEEVEKKIADLWEKPKSLTARIQLSLTMYAPGGTARTEGTGTYELLHRDGKVRFRSEITNEAISQMTEKERRVRHTLTTIGDGEFVYTITDQAGRLQIIKSLPDQAHAQAGSRGMFEELHRGHEVVLLPDAEQGGRRMHVIQATARPGARSAAPVTIYHFDAETGILVKSEGRTADGRTTHVMTLSDLKLDAKLGPERFVLSAPSGTEVVDTTQRSAAPKP